MNSMVRVQYGPYEAHGIIKHKIQKLYGLIKYLQENNYEVDAEPSQHLNRLTIEMEERVIFTADIRHLKFNLPFDEDPICKRIIEVIKLHQELFGSSGNIPKFQHVSAGMRWQRSEELNHSYKVEGASFDDDDDVVPCNSFAQFVINGESEAEEGWGLGLATKDYQVDYATSQSQYVFDYGSFMQEPTESDVSDSQKMDEQKEETIPSSTTSSCICLSADPPSLYSICYGPPTPLNTETSQTENYEGEYDEELMDLNEAIDEAFDSALWQEVLQDSMSPLETQAIQEYQVIGGEGEALEDLEQLQKALRNELFENYYTNNDNRKDENRQSDGSTKRVYGSIESRARKQAGHVSLEAHEPEHRPGTLVRFSEVAEQTNAENLKEAVITSEHELISDIETESFYSGVLSAADAFATAAQDEEVEKEKEETVDTHTFKICPVWTGGKCCK